MLQHSRWPELVVTLLILYAPGLFAWLTGIFKKDKAAKAYTKLLDGKDEEIKRLAAQVKELQNVILKKKR